MNSAEKRIYKDIVANETAIADNLLTRDELVELQELVKGYLDEHLLGQRTDLALRYRKFSKELNTIWADEKGYPIGGEKWFKPYKDFFFAVLAGKTIKARLEDEGVWVEARAQGVEGNALHLFAGSKGEGDKTHIVVDAETGEIRIDKKDTPPGDVLTKVEALFQKPDGTSIKTTMQFLKNELPD